MNRQPIQQGVLAAIDIGTNTIRLLIASPVYADDIISLQPLASETATVRLGQGVERTGQLDPERLARAVRVVEEFRQRAVAAGAAPILLAATSAVRDAANGDLLAHQIAATSGLALPIIDGAREATLTFAGATAGQSLHGTVLVADLGGGSLELIASVEGAVVSAQSLQLGSGRLTERHIVAEPPTAAMVAAAEADARAILASAISQLPSIARLIVVGGTATSVPILAPDPDGALLTRQRLSTALAALVGMPIATVAVSSGLDPERVRTLPAGIAIIVALCDLLGLDTAVIGTGGIREGLLLDYLRRSKTTQ